MPTSQKDYYTFSGIGNAADTFGMGVYFGQTFTATSSYSLDSIALKIKRVGSTGDLTVYLTAVDEDGLPTDDPLSTGVILEDDIPTSELTVCTVSMSAFDIVSGTKYAIYSNFPNHGAPSPLIAYNIKSPSGYANGSYIVNNSGWGEYNTYDMYFIVYATSSPPSKATTPTPDKADTEVDFSDFTLSWEDGGGATSYDVYLGPTGSLTKVSSSQAGLSYVTNATELATLFSAWPTTTSIYWRIDSKNGDGTTTGDNWYFDSIAGINAIRLGATGSFILCTTTRGLYLSTDFGSSWSNVLPDAGATTEWDKGVCSGTGSYLIVEKKSNGALYRSANGGSSWGSITPAGAASFTVNDMKMSESGQYVVVVGTNGTTQADSCYTSADYGVTWTVRHPTTSFTLAWTTCDISDDGQIIMVGATGDLYVTFDGGILWKKQNPPASDYWWESAGISGDGKVGVIVNTGTANEWRKNSGWNALKTVTTTPFTAYARSLLSAENAAEGATALGLGSSDSPTFAGLTLTGFEGFLKATAGVVSAVAPESTGFLLLDQTTHQHISNGSPHFDGGAEVKAGQKLYFDGV